MRQVFPILLAFSGLAASASGITVSRSQPDLDVWNYPFNFTPGYRSAISTFSALGQEELAGLTFDQRDAQMLIAFDTEPDVPTGQGQAAYCISSAVIRINTSTDDAFAYDPTADIWQSYLEPGEPGAVADTDSGRPLEMFGAAFRGGWTLHTYYEGTISAPGPGFGPMVASDVRYVYPTDALAGGTDDVSNNVRDGFDVFPFAIGQCALAPGALVPSNTEFTFTLDVTSPDVQQYLGEALDAGRLMVVLTSLQPAQSGNGGGPGTGSFATWYAKENIFGTGRAARLELEVEIRQPGDVNGDTMVNFDDLNELLSNWGEVVTPGTSGDVDCNGTVDFTDLNILLANWDG